MGAYCPVRREAQKLLTRDILCNKEDMRLLQLSPVTTSLWCNEMKEELSARTNTLVQVYITLLWVKFRIWSWKNIHSKVLIKWMAKAVQECMLEIT